MNIRPILRITNCLPQHLSRNRSNIPFAQKEESEEVPDRVPSVHPKYACASRPVDSLIFIKIAAIAFGIAGLLVRSTWWRPRIALHLEVAAEIGSVPLLNFDKDQKFVQRKVMATRACSHLSGRTRQSFRFAGGGLQHE